MSENFSVVSSVSVKSLLSKVSQLFPSRTSFLCLYFFAFAKLMVIMASLSASLSVCNGKSSFKKGKLCGEEGNVIQLL